MGSKIDPRWSQDRSKTSSFFVFVFVFDFGAFLVPFWFHFRSSFGPILGPQIGQVLTLRSALLTLKRQKSTHGPPRCPKSRPRGTQDRPRPPKTPPDGPRPPQNGSRCPQDAPKRPQIVPRCTQDPLSPLVFLFMFLSLSLSFFCSLSLSLSSCCPTSYAC